MKAIYYYLFFLFPLVLKATVLTPKFDDRGVTGPKNNSFMDKRVDYSQFMGRVSDKDSKSARNLKIEVEVNNTKFFKAGDVVYFRVNRHETELPCRATVKSVEEDYFIIYVTDFGPCWDRKNYFPRGLQLNFKSEILAQRVFEASKYREMLILRKEGYLKQLAGINHFLWTFDQQKMQAIADFDKRINELKRQRQMVTDNMIQSKREKLMLQVELRKKLYHLDDSLEHYRVERGEYLVDRWNMDHDQGVEFPQRPQQAKKP